MVECSDCRGDGTTMVSCEYCTGDEIGSIPWCIYCGGKRHWEEPCPVCHGTGEMPDIQPPGWEVEGWVGPL